MLLEFIVYNIFLIIFSKLRIFLNTTNIKKSTLLKDKNMQIVDFTYYKKLEKMKNIEIIIICKKIDLII